MRYLFIIFYVTLTICSFGESIYFTKDSNIYSMDVNGENIKQITNSRNKEWGMSVDSGFGAYVEDVKQGELSYGRIVIINMESGNRVDEIEKSGVDIINPLLFGELVIYVEVENGNRDIYSYNYKKHKKSRITYGGVSTYPVLNRKEHYILYQEYDEKKDKWSITKYNLSENKREVFLSGDNSYEYHIFSKDEKMICFEEKIKDKSYIAICDVELKKDRRLSSRGKESYVSSFDNFKFLLYLSDGEIWKYDLESGKESLVLLEKKSYLNIVTNPRYIGGNRVLYEYRVAPDIWEIREYDMSSGKGRTVVSGELMTIN